MIFVNTNSNRLSNIECMQTTSTTSFKTISIWYKQLAKSTASPIYLFDGRLVSTGFDNQSYIFYTSIGTYWTNMYRDGGSNLTPTFSGAEFANDTWHNVTFTSSSVAVTGNLTFCGRYSINECANLQVAAVLVYNRQISQAENAQNYAYMKRTYMSAFSLP